jgi:competence protein ComEA
MKLIKKISGRIGFTETESKIILFLLITLSIGIIINIFKSNSNNPDFLEFDYAKEDSAFYNVEDSLEKNREKKVESKSELSDFRTAKKEEKKAPVSFSAANKLDINKALINQFLELPGVGEKTAQNIVEYRNKIGRFNKIDELLNVKGIGKAKFEKIKSFITVK